MRLKIFLSSFSKLISNMPKLFLASSFNVTITEFIRVAGIINPQELKVAFIENAAEPYRGKIELSWVDNDREAFVQNKFNLTDIDLNNYKGDFTEFDIIHCCGGHTRYLLSIIHKLGHFNNIRSAILDKGVIYTGTSAGSMIASPTLFGVGRLDDDLSEVFLESEQVGLNLVDFLILPHFNNPEFIPTNYETIKSTDYQHPLVFLNDNSAIWVGGKKFQIINK
jgi:dipeptidase E